ncbi:MAG TPA: DUF6644 family protein [Gammaproteobacteria bacterium]|nr:DUF6644 family protein [Gammaproteobacteria bacterium]
MENAFIDWVYSTRLSWLITTYGWLWPINESLHFCALTLLAGTVGLFDLRLLGFAKGITPSSLHATLKWGIAGFIVSVVTGVQFFFGAPEQYYYNDAFRMKVVFLVLMGANAALFYWREFPAIQTLGPHDDAPRSAKIVAAASLIFLVGVMLCGRMLTFFRPPFFWNVNP